MPKTANRRKPVRSFRLSATGIGQLKELARNMGRSESNIIEIALDRMYREELRFRNAFIRKKVGEDIGYFVEGHKEEQ